jgi:hypothetical protein
MPLRRPGKVPPARFTRRPARPKREGGTEPQFEAFAKIESSVRGLLAFCGGTALILARMLVRPHRFDAGADRRGYLSPRVHPFTLLTLSAFFSTTTLRVLMVLLIVSVSTVLRGCQAETQVPVDSDAILRDALTLPRVDDVLLIGIPSVVAITLLLRAAQALLRRAGTDATNAEAFFNAGLYIVAFQSLWLLVALGVAASIESWLPENLVMGSFVFEEIAAVLFTVAWPAVMFRKRLRDALGSRPGASGRRPGPVATAALAILLACLTPWPGILVAYPLAARQANRLTEDRPVLKVALADARGSELTLLVSNNTDDTLFLFPDHAQIELELQKDKATVLPLRAGAWQRSRDRILALAPRESRWMTATVTEPDPGYIGCHWRPIVPNDVDSRPLPEGVYARVCLARLESNGAHTPLHAYVRSDEVTLQRVRDAAAADAAASAAEALPAPSAASAAVVGD